MKPKLLFKKRGLLFFVFLICFQYGCVDNKNKYQAYQDMKDFVLDEYNRNGKYLLFFETQNKNKIIFVAAIDMQYPLRHSPIFKGIDIESAFKDIMLGKTILSCRDLGECFALSRIISEEYKKKGIKEFLKIYAIQSEYNYRYVINPNLSNEEKLSVAYYFYLNNIYTLIDDYTGHFISWKDQLFIPVEDLNLEYFEKIEE